MFLLLACGLAVAGLFVEPHLEGLGQAGSLVETVVLIAAILAASLSVARHAERIAQKLGDPYGSMILTLSAVLVEVIVLAIVSSKAGSPTLVRDSIYSAVMLDINGILGVAALIGGFKHGEQAYNDDSARTYSVMILTAVTVSMIIPEFVPQPSWRAYSAFTVVSMLLMYGVFVRMQTGPHSYFFSYSYPDKRTRQPSPASGYPNRRQSVAVMAAGIIAVGMKMPAGIHAAVTGVENDRRHTLPAQRGDHLVDPLKRQVGQLGKGQTAKDQHQRQNLILFQNHHLEKSICCDGTKKHKKSRDRAKLWLSAQPADAGPEKTGLFHFFIFLF